MSTSAFSIKRIYDPASRTDGARVLVDRLWPRGISRKIAHLTLWLREVAPSTALRQWFDHRPDRWEEFRKRYRAELENNPAVSQLHDLQQQGHVTLLYAARNPDINHALVLAEFLQVHTRKHS